MNRFKPFPFKNGDTIGDDLTVQNGRLFFHDTDLMKLIVDPIQHQMPLGTPLEVVYLPKITQQIHKMQRWFAEIGQSLGYSARFEYAYASKANSAEEVTRTALQAGAHYETSSAADIDIVQYLLEQGHLPSDRMCINNGFKVAGSEYMNKIINLRSGGFENVIPVIEDLDEIQPLIDSGLEFKVGLRQKIDAYARDVDGIRRSDIRFGMQQSDLRLAAQTIKDAPNLTLVMYHCMMSDVSTNPDGWLDGFRAGMQVYMGLAKTYPSLSMYNWGGGFPAAIGAAEHFDYPSFIRRMLTITQQLSEDNEIPAPVMVGEFGRYTTAEHGFHIFKVLKAKENGSKLPWYIIDGSVMSSFPDAWALGLAFQVLPINHLDKPFREVRLGGITCDSDDIYPKHTTQGHLFLPVETEDLYVGFFGAGCYQEMLGGVRGVKHCLVPEANELIISQNESGSLHYEVMPGQTYQEILDLLNYRKA